MKLFEKDFLNIIVDTKDKDGNVIEAREYTKQELIFIARKGFSPRDWSNKEALKLVKNQYEKQINEIADEKNETITTKVIQDVDQEVLGADEEQ